MDKAAFIIVIVLLLFISGVGMLQSFLYIKYSWFRRNNSLQLTGAEFAEQEVLAKNLKADIKVETSFFRFRFVKYNKNTQVMKTGYFVSKRKSLWSLADASTQAFAATTIKDEHDGKKPAVAAWVYKIRTPIWTFFLSLLSMISILAMMYGFLNLAINKEGAALAIAGSIGFMAVTVFYAYAVWKGTKAIRDHSDEILGNSLTEDEKKEIQFLWKVDALVALIVLITEVFARVVQIFQTSSKSKSAGNRINRRR